MTTNEIPGKSSTAETFSPGQVLAESLTLKQKLSTSDIGTLWLAADGDSGKDITLLFLPAAILADSRVMDELRIQVKLDRQLIHPHVLRTHDLIEEEGWAAISSDAVEAETLATLLAQKQNGFFEVAEIQPWISNLCQTLDDAHRASLLHRDIVPQNILVPKSGGLLVSNFGISRIILDALGRIQGPGKIDEHLAFLSPQQLDGELPARWDDTYSLGVLIYQLLTSKPPFYAGDILPQIRKNVPPSMSARRAELGTKGKPIPDEWEKVVAACLEKHTPQRPKSMREVGMKLGAEISLIPATQVTVARTETVTPAESKAPQEKKESVKVKEPATSKAPKETKESKESLIEDIVWRKPGQHPQPAPGEPPSYKHLLQKLPEDSAAKKPFPARKAAIAGACAAALLILLLLPKGKHPRQSSGTAVSPTPLGAMTPAPAATAKPTPQVTATEPAKTPAILPSSVSPDKIRALEQARKTLDDMQKGMQEKTKAQQQADADATAAKSALDAKTTARSVIKKAIDDAAALRKQREDNEAKANADVAKAAADLETAQKAAADKARAAADATKAKEQILSQIKEQEDAQQKADAELQTLQKEAADKQAAADTADKVTQDAGAQLQLQQVLVKQEETDALQPAATPAPQATPASQPLPSGTSEALVPITPEKTPAPVSIEAAEQAMVKNLTESHPALNATPAPSATPSMPVTYVPNPKSQIDQTLTNSLGMKFQPVGDVLFCVWLTRIQDFEVFARETHFKGTAWLQPGFKQGPDHPVVYVTWNDAMAFCKWLTEKERKAGLLAPNQSYRLPTDLEWSKAVGLPEESGKTPDDRDVGVKDVYPWGKQWPPPAGAGNYDGEETGSEVSIKGYDDSFVFTSPVGSFAMNAYGLYDMGGNAWEWCMDWFNGEQKQRVLRGASWYNGDLQLSLLSSCRWPSAPDITSDNFGFRCVIATEGKSRK